MTAPATTRDRWLGIALAAAILATGCSTSSDDRATPSTRGVAPTTTDRVPAPSGDRIRSSGTGMRFEISRDRPLFLHNVYLSSEAEPVEQVSQTISLWPEDLRPYLGIQFVLPSQPPLPPAISEPLIDAGLSAADDAQVPALVQVAALHNRTAPDDGVLSRLFGAHPTFGGLGLAEFSAPVDAAVGGLVPQGADLVVGFTALAKAHDAYLLWQDMGYFGPHVFVDAGLDRAVFDAIASYPEGVVLQVKRNGAGKRFVTDAAVYGFWLTGQVGNWGVNSEDWLWWEAGYQRRFEPAVSGAIGITGFPKGDQPDKSRLSYPESLFGTEMIMAAAYGATVFSIESPFRAYGPVDGVGGPTVAATEVVFPTATEMLARRLIADRDELRAATPIAFRVADRAQPELNGDQAFRDLYGAACEGDPVLCSRGAWLQRTGRYGTVPIVPALSPPETLASFRQIVSGSAIGDSAAFRRAIEADTEPPSSGTLWVRRVGDSWLIAHPDENVDRPLESSVTVGAGNETIDVSLTLPAHTFGVITDTGTEVDVWLDNYRSAETWWDGSVSGEAAAAAYGGTDTDADEPDEVTVSFGGARVKVIVDGEAVDTADVSRPLRGRLHITARR